METTITRKSKAKNIEAKIRNGIQAHSAIKIAQAIGVNPSQITR